MQSHSQSRESEEAVHRMSHLISAWVGLGQCTGLGGREEGPTESAAYTGAQRQGKTSDFGSVSKGGGRKNECGRGRLGKMRTFKSCFTLDFILGATEGF